MTRMDEGLTQYDVRFSGSICADDPAEAVAIVMEQVADGSAYAEVFEGDNCVEEAHIVTFMDEYNARPVWSAIVTYCEGTVRVFEVRAPNRTAAFVTAVNLTDTDRVESIKIGAVAP